MDRITPVTETQHKEILSQDFGVTDEWPVVAEHFGQWIIEDHFVNGASLIGVWMRVTAITLLLGSCPSSSCPNDAGERPRWDEVGVMFVPDVKPYECMKLRLLNGSHSALSYVSYLAGTDILLTHSTFFTCRSRAVRCMTGWRMAGFQFVDDAMNNKQIGDFVYSYMDEVCFRYVPPTPPLPCLSHHRSPFTAPLLSALYWCLAACLACRASTWRSTRGASSSDSPTPTSRTRQGPPLHPTLSHPPPHRTHVGASDPEPSPLSLFLSCRWSA